jgi:hypothetical protein
VRYIYYIIIILLGLSAIIGYELRTKSPSTKDAALIVNKQVITTDEFNRLYSLQPPNPGGKSDFINSLMTKELLIQESKREGIDKEESFRRSIQNFYEQSLIKLLIDRKLASLHVTVGDDEVNRYIALLNKKVYLTIFSANSPEEADRGKYTDNENKAVLFDDLSRDIRDSIISLRDGQMTGPIRSGDRYIVIKLDKLENVPSQMRRSVEKDKIRKMLIEEKKEKMLSDWIAGLRKNASVKILINREK